MRREWMRRAKRTEALIRTTCNSRSNNLLESFHLLRRTRVLNLLQEKEKRGFNFLSITSCNFLSAVYDNNQLRCHFGVCTSIIIILSDLSALSS